MSVMLSPEEQKLIRPIVRIQQIIVFALVAGVLFFMSVVLFLSGDQLMGGDDPELLSLMAVGFAVVAGTASVFVPGMIVSFNRRRIADGTYQSMAERMSSPQPNPFVALGDDGRLLAVRQTSIIVGCALLEGAAFFNLIATMTVAWPGNLVVVLFLLLGILARFPTMGRTESWLKAQRRWIKEDRQLRGI